jgi:hypothetical protein
MAIKSIVEKLKPTKNHQNFWFLVGFSLVAKIFVPASFGLK